MLQTREERMEANKFFRAVDTMVYLLEETLAPGEDDICFHEWDDGLWIDNERIKIEFFLNGKWQASSPDALSSTQIVMCEALAKLVPKYWQLNLVN
jgi:hypothetical protein